ncbi:MAG: HigA family addiction module antidote protein [Bacteroidia bacterium]|nr:HigA family addiction module antidote protein [Bacteroidia bacterium]
MVKQNQYFPQVVFHPGETLHEKLEEMGMGPKEFAFRTAKPEKTITAILKGDSSITADMAVQFENVTKIPAHFWLNSQRGYDEYLARVKRQEVIEKAVIWANNFPLLQMIKFGWLEKLPTKQEMAAQLLTFFGVATPQAWEDYYYNQQLKVAFRISLKHTKEPYAISAWLRKSEISAQQIQSPAYSEKTFKDTLPKIKSLMAEHPSDFFQKLQVLCHAAGVKLVYTPCLQKAPINGATRWLGDSPLIQLTGRHKRNDIFWFSFFHEVGHIILHGKKEIFLENIEYKEKDLAKESEADEFAVKWTFSEEEEEELKNNLPASIDEILKYAKKINTHPALIIGRLQHNKDISYSIGKRFFQTVELT